MDRERYPKAARYIDSLPRGLASHPQCQVKGSVLRQMIESTPTPFPTEGLPSDLRSMIDAPPLPSDWIPEVCFNALMLAHEDVIDPRVFREWVYTRNRQLFSSSLYRILFLVVSPERLIVGMTHRWRAFRRGTELQTLERSKNRVVVELSYPENLYELHALTNLTVAVTAALDAAGGKNSDVKLVHHDARAAKLVIRWE